METAKFLNVFLWFYHKYKAISMGLVDIAHKEGLKVSHLVDSTGLHNDEVVSILKKYCMEYGDEIVMWLEPDAQLLRDAEVTETQAFLSYYSKDNKRRMISEMVKLYNEKIGPLKSAAHFNLDSVAVNALKSASPELVCVMTNCFEEGVNVMRGHRYFDIEWINFMEGSPWWPYIPRASNSFAPAGQDDDKIDVVCLPHLNRDLIQAFDARNDWYSSQPMDEMRSKSVWPGNIEYTKRFFNQYMKQSEYNQGYSYYQFLEGPDPFYPDAMHVFDEHSNDIAKVYEGYMAFLGEKVRNGDVRNVSSVEFACWFKEEFKGTTPATIARWKDIRFDSGKEYIWYLDANWRFLFGANRGGSILDMRPYAAKINRELGPDVPNLWNGNYPFIIQNHHRYTSIAKGMIRCNGAFVDLSEIIFQVENVKRSEQETIINFSPVNLDFNKLPATLNTVYKISTQSGTLSIERTLTPREKSTEKVEFCEYLKGTWGTLDIPGTCAGLTLEIAGGSIRKGLIYEHKGRFISSDNIQRCSIGFPVEKFALTLSAENDCVTGKIYEGSVFNTFYEISLEKTCNINSAKFKVSYTIERGEIPSGNINDTSAVAGPDTPSKFKTEWAPEAHPLRCPSCLNANREVHLHKSGTYWYCPYCTYKGNREELEQAYQAYRKRQA